MEKMEQWIMDELDKGTPVYVESNELIRKFSAEFFPEKRIADKYGFKFISDLEGTRKSFQKILYSLRKKGKIEKKAMGVFHAKIDYILGRNWIWGWRKKV